MRKFCFCLIIIISQYSFGQSKISLIIKGSITVQFPKIPNIQNNDFVTYYYIQTDDYFLNIGAVDYDDNEFLKGKELDKEELYSGTIDGVLAAATNGKELSRKNIKIKNWEGLEVKTSSDKGNMKEVISTHTILLIDRVSLMISFTKLSNVNVDDVIEKVILSIEKN